MTEFVQLLVSYDETLVTENFMADRLLELEGVESVEIDCEVTP